MGEQNDKLGIMNIDCQNEIVKSTFINDERLANRVIIARIMVQQDQRVTRQRKFLLAHNLAQPCVAKREVSLTALSMAWPMEVEDLYILAALETE